MLFRELRATALFLVAPHRDECLERVIWGRILRGRHHETRLWNSVDAKWLWRILQSSSRHEHDAENDETIHDTVLELL